MEIPAQLLKFFLIIRNVVIVLDIIIFLLFIYFFIRLMSYRLKFFSSLKNKSFINTLSGKVLVSKEWQKVLLSFKKGTPEAIRFSVIMADSLVDKVLKDLNLKGDSFVERLSLLKGEGLKSFDDLWEAHRLRNELAHSSSFDLSREDAKKALRAYYYFLKELKILD